MNLLFSNGQVKVIVLNKTCNKHLNLLLIEKIKNIFVTYVDIYDTNHTNKKFSLGTGPFLMRITNSFTAFCKDFGYELSYENKGKVFLNLIKFKLIVLKNSILTLSHALKLSSDSCVIPNSLYIYSLQYS